MSTTNSDPNKSKFQAAIELTERILGCGLKEIIEKETGMSLQLTQGSSSVQLQRLDTTAAVDCMLQRANDGLIFFSGLRLAQDLSEISRTVTISVGKYFKSTELKKLKASLDANRAKEADAFCVFPSYLIYIYTAREVNTNPLFITRVNILNTTRLVDYIYDENVIGYSTLNGEIYTKPLTGYGAREKKPYGIRGSPGNEFLFIDEEFATKCGMIEWQCEPKAGHNYIVEAEMQAGDWEAYQVVHPNSQN